MGGFIIGLMVGAIISGAIINIIWRKLFDKMIELHKAQEAQSESLWASYKKLARYIAPEVVEKAEEELKRLEE